MTQNHANPYAPPSTDPTPGFDPSDSPLASRGSRFGAALLDGVILMFVIIPIQYMLGVYDGFPNIQPPGFLDQLIASVGGIVAYGLINGKYLAENGQTIGKKALGVRIVNTDGSKPSAMDIVLKRYTPFALIGLVPAVGPILSLVNALIIFGAAHRCGHDHIAGTKVVQA